MTSQRQANRRGVATLETAMLLPVLLLVLTAMLDLGLVTIQHAALTSAARVLARQASLCGPDAPPPLVEWGPAAMAGDASDGSLASSFIENRLPAMAAGDVGYEIAWIEPDIGSRRRLQVTLTFRHEPLLTSISPWGAIRLEASASVTQLN